MDEAQRSVRAAAHGRGDQRGALPALPRLRARARRQPAPLPAGPPDPAARLPRLAPPLADRPRAPARDQGRVDRRLQPPQLPRPVRDRRHASVAAPDAVRGQGRAVRAPLAGMAPVPGRRLPDPARAVGRDRDGDRPAGPRPRRHGLHLPRGDADPVGLAGDAEARRRPPGAGDRRRGGARRRARDRAGAARLADPPPQGEAAGRAADDLPAHRASLAGARRHRHRLGSGPTSSSSGSGSAACRRCARPR